MLEVMRLPYGAATTTHDKGGITDNDIRIAQEFESILETYD